jgi:5-methylcytosine-specific restriction endonuclease McrA
MIPHIQPLVITRAAARAAGMEFYFTGKPCKHGHLCERRASNGECVKCERFWNERLQKNGWYAAWDLANIEKRRQQKAAYMRRNPKKRALTEKNRRARKRGAGGDYTMDDLVRIWRTQKRRCANPKCCKKLGNPSKTPRKGELIPTVDHRKAIINGGDNSPSNIQLLCAPCNSAKGTRDEIDHNRSNGFLL